MGTPRMLHPSPYEGIALLADPIHRYILFTVPREGEEKEKTEKDLIDSPWIQRLRKIHQLQSTWWVYPAGEHSRFQHVLGTMHTAGEFARHLSPSLHEVFPRELPSFPYIEELLRVAGLLHDVGHGPFGHFFDDHFLKKFDLTHEILGMEIITQRLGAIIRGIRRSPTGPFARGEVLEPEQVAFLIKKPEAALGPDHPRWLRYLQPLFSGIYTVDNLDYVQRDAYMTGFSLDLVDVERLLLYSFFSQEGLTLHKAGESALIRFITAKFALYQNVYHHRTTRAIDLHLKEIFSDTMKLLAPYNPRTDLDRYLELTDWFILERVREWERDPDPEKQRLGREWAQILGRNVKWKMAYDFASSLEGHEQGVRFTSDRELEEEIRKHLPSSLRQIPFQVDIAHHDPRPVNPLAEGSKRITIYNPATGEISPRPVMDLFAHIPSKVARYRVFTLDKQYLSALAKAAEKALRHFGGEAVPTNI